MADVDPTKWDTTPKPIDLDEWIPGEWVIDPTHSQVMFMVRHTIVPIRCAFIDFKGTITTAEHPEDSKVEVTINAGSFSTGFAYRDGRIANFPDLLNAAGFPEITFTSNRVTSQGNGRHWIDGELTARGVTRPVRLDAQLIGFSDDDEYGARVGFTATANLDRRDFGMTAKTPRFRASGDFGDGNHMLGWGIDVEITIEAVSPTRAGSYGLDRILGEQHAAV